MNTGGTIAAELFSDLLQRVAERLQPLCFKMSGTKFIRKKSIGSLAISFQKSVESTKDDIYFTADISLSHAKLSKRLAKLGFSTLVSSHYRQRVSSLVTPPRDQWWHIYRNVDLDDLESDVWGAIENYAIPELMKYTTEEALRNLWQSGKSPGLTETQRIICLATLLKEMGQELELQILEAKTMSDTELKRRGQAAMIESVFHALQPGN